MLSVVTVDTSKLDEALKDKRQLMSKALSRMAQSILTTSLMKTPKLNGPLRDSGKVVARGDEATVSYGDNGRIVYARYQEIGSTTGKPWHYTTPGTGPHFLADATAAVVKKGLEAFL